LQLTAVKEGHPLLEQLLRALLHLHIDLQAGVLFVLRQRLQQPGPFSKAPIQNISSGMQRSACARDRTSATRRLRSAVAFSSSKTPPGRRLRPPPNAFEMFAGRSKTPQVETFGRY